MALSGKPNDVHNRTKGDLVDIVAKKANFTKTDTDEIVTELFEAIKRTVKSGGYLTIQNFGTFELVRRKARKGTNFKTGKTIKIPAKNVVKFKPSKNL